MKSAHITLYPLTEVATNIGIDYNRLKHYAQRNPDSCHRFDKRLFMTQNQIDSAKAELSRTWSSRINHDTGTHLSARLAVMTVCDLDDRRKSNLGGRAAEIVKRIGLGSKIGTHRTAPVEVAKSDLPALAIELHRLGFPVRSEYLPQKTAKPTQPELSIGIENRTESVAKLLGLTTEQAAELYLSLAADILERLK